MIDPAIFLLDTGSPLLLYSTLLLLSSVAPKVVAFIVWAPSILKVIAFQLYSLCGSSSRSTTTLRVASFSIRMSLILPFLSASNSSLSTNTLIASTNGAPSPSATIVK